MSQTPCTNLFTNDFPSANPNQIFINDMLGQEYDFPHTLETPNALSTTPEISISSNDYAQPAPHDLYSLNIPGQETDMSNNLEMNSYEPSSSQETCFSSTSTSTSNDFSHDSHNPSEIFAGPKPRRSEEFAINHPDSQATHLTTHPPPSIQELHTSSPSNPPSPSSPSGSHISPDRHPCPHCPRTFKRPGDVKRHEKVHIPSQRRFHCWQVGCERRGWRGFYRRDKLRDHAKTAHGL
jgi:hypothetical protein